MFRPLSALFHRSISAARHNKPCLCLRHSGCFPQFSFHISRVAGSLQDACQLLFSLLMMFRIFFQFYGTILLHPFPCGVGRHRNTAILCLPQPCLYFCISSCLICQKLLPMVRSPSISPGEKFSAL